MKGFLLVDKEKGDSSFDVVRSIRKLTGEKKVGHAGTLDPLATGLLLVAVGEGTKLLEYFVGCDKEYEVTACFGAVSDTYDAEGQISTVDFDAVIEEGALSKIVEQKFLGKFDQVPPAYSALKIDGKKAYELARAGEEVNLKSREVLVDEFELQGFTWPKAKFRIVCSSGTYIRSLIHDLGKELGCGAYVKELRRTKVGSFNVAQAQPVEKLSFISLENMVKSFPRIDLNEGEFGQLNRSGIILDKKVEQKFSMTFFESNLVAVLEDVGGALKNRKRIW